MVENPRKLVVVTGERRLTDLRRQRGLVKSMGGFDVLVNQVVTPEEGIRSDILNQIPERRGAALVTFEDLATEVGLRTRLEHPGTFPIMLAVNAHLGEMLPDELLPEELRPSVLDFRPSLVGGVAFEGGRIPGVYTHDLGEVPSLAVAEVKVFTEQEFAPQGQTSQRRHRLGNLLRAY